MTRQQELQKLIREQKKDGSSSVSYRELTKTPVAAKLLDKTWIWRSQQIYQMQNFYAWSLFMGWVGVNEMQGNDLDHD